MKNIPEIGKTYNCFDDGKISRSRMYQVTITEIVPFEDADDELLELWEEEGAKWQAERSYSEEEVGELLYNVIGEYGKHYGVMIDGKMLNDLFEQFKKK